MGEFKKKKDKMCKNNETREIMMYSKSLRYPQTEAQQRSWLMESGQSKGSKLGRQAGIRSSWTPS